MNMCDHCGKELKANSKFCQHCGAPAPIDEAPSPSIDQEGPIGQTLMEDQAVDSSLTDDNSDKKVIRGTYTPPSQAENPYQPPEESQISYRPASQGKTTYTPPVQSQNDYQQASSARKEKKPFNKRILLFGGLGFLLVIILITIFSKAGGKEKVNPFIGLWEATTLEAEGESQIVNDLFPDGMRIEVLEDGKWILDFPDLISPDEVEDSEFTWKSTDQGIDFIVDGEAFTGVLKEGDLFLEDFLDYAFTLVKVDGKLNKTEQDSKDKEGIPGLEKWKGKWYGYFWVTEPIGEAWKNTEDFMADATMVLDIGEDGKGKMEITYEGSQGKELLASGDIFADQDHFEVTKGEFFDSQINTQEWWIGLSPVDEGNLIVIADTYLEANADKDEGFEYMLVFRPYGELWENEVADGDILPPGYKDYEKAIKDSGEKPKDKADKPKGDKTKPTSGASDNAGLPPGNFSGSTKEFSHEGITVLYPSGFEAQEGLITGIEVSRDSTWVNIYFDEDYSPVTKSLDDVKGELDYKLESGDAESYESSYSGQPCLVLMLDSDTFGPEIEIYIPLEGKVLQIMASTSDFDSLDELLKDQDIMAIMTNVTW